MGADRHRRRRGQQKAERYVALAHWLMRTEAWRSLDCVSRCAYIEIKSRYAGPNSNNGRIPFSLREMAEALNVGKMTAQRAMQRLQERGFIVMTKRGAFSRKVRHATEWRLTEHMCDLTGALPTKEFTRWQSSGTVSQEDLRKTKHGSRDDTARVSR